MYKIMLAEDELEVLMAMTNLIKWEKYGFETPIGARDGKEAITKLDEGFLPDVLITDICMPFIDGLELTRYINEHMPETIVVILTGYDEFTYAQKAIKLQVYDYVLKPVTPSRINELIKRLKAKLDSLQRNGDTMKIVSSHFLNRLVTKKLDTSVIEENCSIHKLSFVGRYHMAAVLDVDLPTPMTSQETNNLELMRYGLSNISQELAEKFPGTVVFQGNDGICDVLISADNNSEAYTLATELMKLISNTASKSLNVPVSAGIGEPVAYLDELWISRNQAVSALGYRFFYGDASVTCSADIDIKKSRDIDYSAFAHNLEITIKAMDRVGAANVVKMLMDAMRTHHLPFDRCVLYSQKLVMTLIHLVDEMLGSQEVEALEKLWDEVNFYTVPNLARLEHIIIEICERAFESFDLVKTDSAAAQVLKAETYIKERYNDPGLSLNTVTEHLAISTSYFSAIFKAKTGSTFVEYLTKLRMDKAKQVLTLTDRRTYEVAEDVGFSDPHYFSVAFKRVTGMTPKEYREFNQKH